MVEQGQIVESDFVCRAGGSGWVQAKADPALSALFQNRGKPPARSVVGTSRGRVKAAVIVLILVASGWFVWPYYALYGLAGALREGDTAGLENRIAWASVPSANDTTASEQPRQFSLNQVSYAFFSGGPFTFKVEIIPENDRPIQSPVTLLFRWSGDWKLARVVLPADAMDPVQPAMSAQDPSPDSQRRALDDRKVALMAGSIAPGSALSCLDELAGEAVDACEKGVFASPEAVAAAVKYVTAQIALLDAGAAYANRFDASSAAELAPLRTAVELDRFGLVAQVLKEREGCTVDRCDALTRFRDSTRVLANLRDGTFEGLAKKYTAIWNAPRPAEGLAAAAGPTFGLPWPGEGTVAPRYADLAMAYARPIEPPGQNYRKEPWPEGPRPAGPPVPFYSVESWCQKVAKSVGAMSEVIYGGCIDQEPPENSKRQFRR
jgi:hypothetical protein